MHSTNRQGTLEDIIMMMMMDFFFFLYCSLLSACIKVRIDIIISSTLSNTRYNVNMCYRQGVRGNSMFPARLGLRTTSDVFRAQSVELRFTGFASHPEFSPHVVVIGNEFPFATAQYSPTIVVSGQF
jgi:hypothetical protein